MSLRPMLGVPIWNRPPNLELTVNEGFTVFGTKSNLVALMPYSQDLRLGILFAYTYFRESIEYKKFTYVDLYSRSSCSVSRNDCKVFRRIDEHNSFKIA